MRDTNCKIRSILWISINIATSTPTIGYDDKKINFPHYSDQKDYIPPGKMKSEIS